MWSPSEKYSPPDFALCYSFSMEITIKIPDELAAQAQARTPEEIRAWLDSLAQFSDKIPPLPETISREWIYQDDCFVSN
jgi:hypothetical protein